MSLPLFFIVTDQSFCSQVPKIAANCRFYGPWWRAEHPNTDHTENQSLFSLQFWSVARLKSCNYRYIRHIWCPVPTTAPTPQRASKHGAVTVPLSCDFAVVRGNAFSSIIRCTEERRGLPSRQQFDFLCGVSSHCKDNSVRLSRWTRYKRAE